MTQWPIQRNIYTLVSQTNSMNKTNQQESTNILTAHNINTPRLSSTNNHHTSQQQQQQQQQQSSTLNTFDDSLTNLSWLHDINILKRTMPPINSSSSTTNNKRKEQPSPCSSSSNRDSIYPNDISDNNDLTINNDDDDDQWRMYKTNPQAKPVYSYSQLILFALKQSGHDKMTLQMIYDWVAENFPYFRKMEPTWQNSIRHNLSLNKWFIKVPRTKKEAGGGKGGFWKLSPDYERQRSLIHIQQQQQQLMNSTHNKRSRHSKRSTPLSLNQIVSNNVTPLTKNSSRISYENIKTEPWIDPILPCIGSKNQSPLHCHTAIIDRSYVRMPSSFLSPTSSPDSLTISPFNNQQINDLSSILTPSPSSSPSSMSSVISKQNLNGTKLDDTDMLLLDSSTFDWDAYLCETTNDIDVQPLLSSRTEHDLFNDFNAALSDLTSSAEAAAAAGADTNNAFDAFDYTSKHSTFNCLFEDDDQSQQQQQQQQQIIESSNNSAGLTIKGSGIKRPSWWITNESITSTKLPSLETAFDLKLSK
ncbi:unnamed protein product [Rotaria sordida]|uniref:Fork-head domain-containing protein n=1 Tax=Rotaria sordida TaxID=392033 RepID=A0A818NF72_9BILA|nr:unnamed protein product [Rotaria sordida]